MIELRAGLEAEVQVLVAEENTARTVGSGSLQVLATPMLVAAMERAACQAIEEALGEGETSVGTWVAVEHLAPTPVGGEVRVRARLTDVDGRSLTFVVEASDTAGLVGRGEHKRFIVNAERFMGKAAKRLG